MNSAETLIIGSGPSGISAAWPLVLAGREVALVDGINQSMPLPPAMSIRKFREDPASWKYIYGSDLSGLHIDKNISPKFATPIGQRLLADDGFESQLNLRDFFGQRALMPGGQSLVWGAFCSTFDNKDLMEFPVNQSDLMDGYKSVASRIGLSGGNDDMGEFHGTYYDLHHPPALNSLIADVYDRYKKIKFDPNEFKLGLARNAVITRNVDGREGCNECGLCLYGCSRNSIYSSDLEIEKLNKFPNFKYFPNSVVSKLISLDGVNKKIEINRSSIVDVRRLVLAAGTISSTALILEYAGFYRTKIPLLSNPCAAMAFIMPKYIQTNFPEKSFGLGQLSYRLGLNPEEDYVTGVLYAADTLPLDVFARHLPFTSLVAFKLTSAILPAIMPVTAYLSSKFSHNYLSIDRNGKNVEISWRVIALRLLRGISLQPEIG